MSEPDPEPRHQRRVVDGLAGRGSDATGIAELPALSRAAAALADDGVTVLLVSIDRGGAKKAMPFLQTHGVSGVALGFDPKAKLSREIGVRGLPTTLLLNGGQTDAWRFVGPFEWDEPAMLEIIRGLLAD